MNILVIEDEDCNYFLIEGLLQVTLQKDFQIKRISSFTEALGFDYTDFKLIIMDLHLPISYDDKEQVSPMQFYQHIRKLSNIPIIFWTGSKYESIKEYVSEDKNAYYVAKHNAESIIDLISTIIK